MLLIPWLGLARQAPKQTKRKEQRMKTTKNRLRMAGFCTTTSEELGLVRFSIHLISEFGFGEVAFLGFGAEGGVGD